jgi:hypothetical protein
MRHSYGERFSEQWIQIFASVALIAGVLWCRMACVPCLAIVKKLVVRVSCPVKLGNLLRPTDTPTHFGPWFNVVR